MSKKDYLQCLEMWKSSDIPKFLSEDFNIEGVSLDQWLIAYPGPVKIMQMSTNEGILYESSPSKFYSLEVLDEILTNTTPSGHVSFQLNLLSFPGQYAMSKDVFVLENSFGDGLGSHFVVLYR